MIKIPVEIPGLKKRRRSIGLLHIVAGFFLVANAFRVYQLNPQKGYLLLLPLILVATVSVIYGAFRAKIDEVLKYNFPLRLVQAFTFLGYAIAFIQSGISGQSLGLFLWVAIALMLAFTERIVVQEQTVNFFDRGFDFPAGYRRKLVMWQEVAEVTLRPDFLTVHYKDNGFLQFELQEPVSLPLAAKLQEFCKSGIENSVVVS